MFTCGATFKYEKHSLDNGGNPSYFRFSSSVFRESASGLMQDAQEQSAGFGQYPLNGIYRQWRSAFF
jgi:hypothetical protein